MYDSWIMIITAISMVIWSAVIFELRKTDKKQNERRIVILTCIGSLLVLILTFYNVYGIRF